MSMTYLEHEHAAVRELRTHIMNCKHAKNTTTIERMEEAAISEEGLYADGRIVRFVTNNSITVEWASP